MAKGNRGKEEAHFFSYPLRTDNYGASLNEHFIVFMQGSGSLLVLFDPPRMRIGCVTNPPHRRPPGRFFGQPHYKQFNYCSNGIFTRSGFL